LRQNTDHVPHPAVFTRRGSESPCTGRLSPACHGDAPLASARTVSKSSDSIVRHAVATSGAMRLTSTSVRQSND
jgi:hypothetical protein